MTKQELKSLGFYQDGVYIKQIYNPDGEEFELGWFGIRGNYKDLTPIQLINKVYKAGRDVGYKEGSNSVRKSINDILKIEE